MCTNFGIAPGRSSELESTRGPGPELELADRAPAGEGGPSSAGGGTGTGRTLGEETTR
jgi:hypothetical protein